MLLRRTTAGKGGFQTVKFVCLQDIVRVMIRMAFLLMHTLIVDAC